MVVAVVLVLVLVLVLGVVVLGVVVVTPRLSSRSEPEVTWSQAWRLELTSGSDLQASLAIQN